MKFLIGSLRVFYFLSSCIFLIMLYATFFKGFEWILFAAMALFLSMCLRKDIQEMEDDIDDHLESVSKALYIHCNCNVEESGTYTMEHSHNGKMYYIDYEVEITGYEDRGAEFLGDYERFYVYERKVTILNLECQNEFGEPYDCGFTKQDLQDIL